MDPLRKQPPGYLKVGDTNIYREIAIALKSGEWRAPGLSVLASAISKPGGEHTAIEPNRHRTRCIHMLHHTPLRECNLMIL